MPICFDKKIAFIHIPKTGGQSIIRMFDFKTDQSHFYGHHSINQINEKINLNDFYKFSFVRNPFDRLLSDFSFRPHNGPFFKTLKLNQYNFENFIHKLYHYQIVNLTHFDTTKANLNPQCDFITGDASLDFLGRFENFENDLNLLLKKFNIDKPICHANKTKHLSYKNYYSNTTKKLVEQMYEIDLNKFNYQF